MAQRFQFQLHWFGKMHDGRIVSTVATNMKEAEENIRAMYPGYGITNPR